MQTFSTFDMRLKLLSNRKDNDHYGFLFSTNKITVSKISPILIQKVPEEWNWEDLYTLCSSVGPVVSMTRLVRKDGLFENYALVEYEKVNHNVEAIKRLNHAFTGSSKTGPNRILVNLWKEEKQTELPTDLYFTNIPSDLSLANLLSLCKAHGRVCDGTIYHGKIDHDPMGSRYALVRFLHHTDAAETNRFLNGAQLGYCTSCNTYQVIPSMSGELLGYWTLSVQFAEKQPSIYYTCLIPREVHLLHTHM